MKHSEASREIMCASQPQLSRGAREKFNRADGADSDTDEVCVFWRVTAKEGGGALLLCTSPSALRGGFFSPRGGGLEKNKTLKAMPLSIPNSLSAE